MIERKGTKTKKARRSHRRGSVDRGVDIGKGVAILEIQVGACCHIEGPSSQTDIIVVNDVRGTTCEPSPTRPKPTRSELLTWLSQTGSSFQPRPRSCRWSTDFFCGGFSCPGNL
jgi:hypothetical protein